MSTLSSNAYSSMLANAKPKSVAIRKTREALIMAALVCFGLFTLVVTGFIVYLLVSETVTFFTKEMTDIQGETVTVSLWDFFGHLNWAPTSTGERSFGIWALIVGTGQITVVAMLIALPLGLITAIWLSEYATPKVRGIVKPVLEVIAGIPTVVFGFFAITVITQILRVEFVQQAVMNPTTGGAVLDSAGNPVMAPANPMHFSIYNGLSAGIAVGIMCIPIVTSLSEDALRAVPRALREGAYGLGTSRFETSIKVVVPAALSGIVAAFLLAIARAVGETMIVAMAAGSMPPNLRESVFNLFMLNEDTQTMTGFLVMIFTGDIQHGGVEYQSSYAVALTLFVITLGFTLIGAAIRKRFRQAYD